ncbi:hypothetical protein KEM54_000089 [Ascosphaera aggregata]|nr:hypothetical protein KEM54_000089 [Ascosphaera aggregata]
MASIGRLQTGNRGPIYGRTRTFHRNILYHQTHYINLPGEGGKQKYVDLDPIIKNNPGLTHLILAAVHINEDPEKITLNDDPFDHDKFNQLWSQVRQLQAIDVKVMCMLGGAAKGSFRRLDQDEATFERYYVPLRDKLRHYELDGIDLDVEESMSQAGIGRLIDRLRADFEDPFLITLAPVCSAMFAGQPHLSRFSYHALERTHGHAIAWYHVQCYNGWGDIRFYRRALLQQKWKQQKMIMGVLTHPDNGSGFSNFNGLSKTLTDTMNDFPQMGGVVGWELFNAAGDSGGNAVDWIFNIALIFALKRVDGYYWTNRRELFAPAQPFDGASE